MKINRRKFILGSAVSAFKISPLLAKNISQSANIVIVGGGWGGLSAAKTLKKLNFSYKVTLVEKEDNFISCPISNWVIGQIKQMEDISFTYDKFAKNNDINLLKKQISYIDRKKRKIFFDKDFIYYDFLILSPGVDLDYTAIDGYNHNFISGWKAGKETRLLSEQVRQLENNQKFLISVPLSPYRCPPGPYERASLIASYIKTKKLKSKVVILDANQKIVSKGNLFKRAWTELYTDIIEYHPSSNVIEVNEKEKKVFTDFDEYTYSFANIIPQQKAANLLFTSNLIEPGRRWAKVNPYNLSSIIDSNIFIIGDSIDASSLGSVPKSGYIAYSMGKACGYAVHNTLLGKDPPSPSFINTCYSLVSNKEGISVSAVYKFDKQKKKIISISQAKGLSPKRSQLVAENAWGWAISIWFDMLS